MKAEELYNEWTEGESSGVRPARVQELRDELRRHTGLAVPRRVPEIESWLPRMKGQITKKLKQAAQADEESEEEAEGEEDSE